MGVIGVAGAFGGHLLGRAENQPRIVRGSALGGRGQHDARTGRHRERLAVAAHAGQRRTLTRHAARSRLDPYAVGRPAVGNPPRVVVEPQFAVPTTRVQTRHHDVAVGVLADDIAASRDDARQHDAAHAVGVLDLHRNLPSRKRRHRACGRRLGATHGGAGPLHVGPPAHELNFERLLHGRRVAAQFGQEIVVGGVLAGRGARLRSGVESCELREVDGTRVRQPGDDLLREEVLHLLRRELAAKAAQELAGVIGTHAVDRDGGEHVAVMLGDRQMQAQVGRDEALQLLADRGDQGAVGAEMLQPRRAAGVTRTSGRGFGQPVADVAARCGPRRRAGPGPRA